VLTKVGDDCQPARVWNIPDRSVVLAGHRQLLAGVQRTLLPGDAALLCTAGGRAGTGGTTAAVEFAHRHVRDYDIGWWVPAADSELVPTEMAALAEALGLAGPADDAEEATARLLDTLAHRGRYLLVFDDAENPRQLARFLPTGHGHVVIISPDPDWRAYATAHTVEPFTRSESVALLRARRPDLPVDAAARVAAVLEDLPLAVDPAAALLAERGTSVEGLLADLGARDGRDPVAAMWTVAFDRLAAVDPAAMTVLTLAAWLGAGPVPLRLMTDYPHALPESLAALARSPGVLAERTTALRRHGLARVTPVSVQLHRVPATLLVARTAQDDLGDDGQGWAGAAIRLLRAAVDPGGDPTAAAAWRQLLPLVLAATDPARRLDGSEVDAGWLLRRAAAYLDARGQRRTAAVLSQDGHSLCAGRETRRSGSPP
jgi:hypothetical protein